MCGTCYDCNYFHEEDMTCTIRGKRKLTHKQALKACNDFDYYAKEIEVIK